MSPPTPPPTPIAIPGSVRTLAQLGQSLDGRIATASGHSHYINGAAALDHLHHLRAWADAVVVGIGTVLADDPQLTVRRCAGADPVRVIIDPRGRLPSQRRCQAVLQISAPGAPPPPPGATRLTVAPVGGQMPPQQIIEALVARGLERLLIEGGAHTVSVFLAANALDRLHLLVGSVIIGAGAFGLTLPPIERLEQARRPAMSVQALGDTDVLLDLDLRQDHGSNSVSA